MRSRPKLQPDAANGALAAAHPHGALLLSVRRGDRVRADADQALDRVGLRPQLPEQAAENTAAAGAA